MFWVHCGLFVLVIAVPGFNSSADSTSKREADYTLDDSFWNDETPSGEVEKLLREYQQNQEIVQNIRSHSYQIIYPVQFRHHEKMGISTREAGVPKRTGYGDGGYQGTRGRSRGAGKHFHRTSLLIKAFNHKFRLDLELNAQLLAPNLIQKDFLGNGVEQETKQEIEHCYYHGTVKDYPGASAAFHTCNGVSGVIHLGNETFVIQPFYGGDLSRHPHFIFEARTNSNKGCANTSPRENRTIKNRREPYMLGLTQTTANRYKRDVRETIKYIETAIVIDKAMFDKRNGSSRSDVVHDAIQVANIADLYFRTLNTRVSVIYVETWLGGNQAQIDSNMEIYKALTNFNDYLKRNMYKVTPDTTQLLTGETFQGGASGLATESTACTTSAVGVSVDTNTYEPHILAGTMAHMIGHNIGMGHDDGRDNCFCRDWHGCIMAKSIVGLENIQPYKFSNCSKSDYHGTLQVGNDMCLFNKPNELKLRSCGNKVIDDGEQCDCGTIDECRDLDPCCDPVTCKLKSESQCASGPCCSYCKLRAYGHVCRESTNECDLPEVCSGESGQCPVNVYKKNGTPCSKNTSHCFNGFCPSLDLQCEQVWGQGAMAADKECFEQFNSKGSINGHCGTNTSGHYIKCEAENVICGSLQCRFGKKQPIISQMDQSYLKTIVSIKSKEYECKATTGKVESSDIPGMGLVRHGTSCGDNLICYNQTCTSLFPHIDHKKCPSNHNEIECSGNGACTNLNKCYCYPGWSGPDCSIQQDIPTLKPTTTTTEKPGKSTTEPKLQKKETPYDTTKSTLSTTAMVLILLGVVKGVFVSFALMALCYRRKSTIQKYDPPYSVNPAQKPFTGTSANNRSEGDALDGVNKMISFRRMPTYSETQRVLFQPQNNVGNVDGPRLKEHKPQTIRRRGVDDEDGGTGAEEAVSFIDLPSNSLAKLPEKGILKKPDGYGMADGAMMDMQRTLNNLNGYHGHLVDALRTAESHRGMSNAPSSSSNLIDEDGLRKSLAECGYADAYSKLQQQQTSQQQPDGPDDMDNQDDDYEKSVPPSCGPIRIRTLEDIIRQLENYSTRHMSPSGSEDMRISEGEGDRHYRIDSSACSESSQGSRRCSRVRDDERFTYGRYRQPSSRSPYGTHQHTHQHSHQMHEEEGIYETADPDRGPNTRGETPDSESDEFIQAQRRTARWTSEARYGVGGSGRERGRRDREISDRAIGGLEHRPPQQPPPPRSQMAPESQIERLSMEEEAEYRRLLSLTLPAGSSTIAGKRSAIVTTMRERIMKQLKEPRERMRRQQKLPANKQLPISERGYYPSPPQTDVNGLKDPRDHHHHHNHHHHHHHHQHQRHYRTGDATNAVNSDRINVSVDEKYRVNNDDDDDEIDDNLNDENDAEEEEEEEEEIEEKAVDAQFHHDIKLLNNNDDTGDAILTNVTRNPDENISTFHTAMIREIDVKKNRKMIEKLLPNVKKCPVDDKYSLGCKIIIDKSDDYDDASKPIALDNRDNDENDVSDDANDPSGRNNTSNNTSDNENTALLPPSHFPEYKH